jgi:hypothetical protein
MITTGHPEFDFPMSWKEKLTLSEPYWQMKTFFGFLLFLFIGIPLLLFILVFALFSRGNPYLGGGNGNGRLGKPAPLKPRPLLSDSYHEPLPQK